MLILSLLIMIIGLVGFIGSGKDTVASRFISYGCVKDSFAAPLKDACAAIFGWPRELLEGDTVDSPDKDVIRAIGLLVTYGILSDARLTGVTEEFIYDCLGSDYSGGVVENADGTLTIF